MDPTRFSSQLDNYFSMIDHDIEMLKSFDGSVLGRNFALYRVLFRMNLLCMWIRGCSKDLNDKVIEYDKSLKSKSLEFYNSLADFEYLPGTHFKYIKKWRASGYKYQMKFSVLDRVQIGIGIRIYNLYMANA
jgi:hypothetical protein